ncbi:U3 small nucleolar RNA-associated protein 21 [Angomonas deanei]|uniref:Nucleoporin Nup120/160/WD domain, G-beta repeat/Utp21 specific WD40 associated putative domain containing protein, putative n=1 Tax=Angomonas deanei TaxID=59799 RepID=A0A7G2BZK6_9TRYP|nr:U3 small nucleolar RNA-associated protein 21 [Angomonas deanei]CAD2212969.1 Nucleoporin Nup120/160/WD domain, G-beta repeat/Utp21 specific WD40 associated putative domain containing protein, putative [Angomonas deanei]|eukprot:EPY26244.1 U3 small nucleolar RNA-associated protein 21 [Angomonas deanei]
MRLQHPNHLLSANKTHSQDLLLGKGRNMLKLPPATQLVAASTRNYQWASILSLHEASSLSCGWRLDTRALAFKLSGIQTGAHTARSIAISDCGNFAVVGYSSGNVTVITLQNKSIRQLIDPSLERVEGGFPPRTHDSAVECVEVTGGNQVIFTASLDCCLKYWDLRSGKLLTTTKTALPASKSCVHPSADLVMVVQHLSVYIYHSNPHRFSVAGQEEEKEGALEVEDSFHHPVRVLHGHTSPITAIALAPDTYRYLATAGGDGSLLLWDISASACVGQYRFLSPALSLHFHPDALFLATTHAGERGAFLWVNNLRYGYVPEVVPHPEEIPTETLTCLHFPTTHGTEEEEEEKGGEETESQRALRAAESDKVEADLFDPKRDVALQQQKRLHEAYAYLDGLPADGVQLAADLPRSLWWNVPLVEEMKEKNQPLLPAKKKDVPFFLPQTQELRPTFLVVASDAGKRTEGDKGEDTARDMNLNQLTPFQKLLRQRQFDEALQYLVALQTAPAIDLEVRQLAIYHHTGSLEEEVVYTEAELLQMNDTLTSFLELVHFFLKERRAVDLVQGLLADFLRCHVSLLTRLIGSNAPRLGDLLRSVMEEQRLVKDTVRHMVAYPDCLVNTFTGSSFI